MIAAIGPTVARRAVVGGPHHQRVLCDTNLIEQVQQLADVVVHLHHAVGVNPVTALALILRRQVGAVVHPS